MHLRLSAFICGFVLLTCVTQARSDETKNFIVERDVTFLPPDRAEKLDLYLPPDPKDLSKRPAIIIIHGGGWKFGDKAEERETQIAALLANKGYVCISINYLLADPKKIAWPTCLEDCRAAIKYLKDHSEEFLIDTNRIGAIGGSAGGTMSLLIANPPAKNIKSDIKAVVALYPVTDLMTTTWELSMLFGQPRGINPEIYKSASPLHQIKDGFPPTLLIHGTADPTVAHEQSEKLAARFTELKVPHELLLLKDVGHTFNLHGDGIDVRTQVGDFFDKYLKSSEGK